MPQRVEERLRPITPQLAWRVAVLGGIAFVLFAIVFFRLWYLQVLSGQDYVSIARENRVRKERIEAPRGDIVDSKSNQLVKTKRAQVVQLVPSKLPKAIHDQADQYREDLAAAWNDHLAAIERRDAYERQLRDDGHKMTRDERRARNRLKKLARAPREVAVPELPADEEEVATLYRRVGEVLHITPKTIHRRVVRGIADSPYSNVTIRTDVPPAEFNHMRERPEYFEGVVVTTRYLRLYPEAEQAAQLFGTVSEISEEQIESGDEHYEGIEQGTRIGQSGLEYYYDKFLRGVDGYSNVVVDAHGSRDERRKVTVAEPTQGKRLKLTLDLDLQKAADHALDTAIARSPYGATAGAYIAMDPIDGAIKAMGSVPRFDANVFARPFSQKTWDFLTSDETSAPLLDRVTESAYPAGSVFKPITALAALHEGLIDAKDYIHDTGTYELGPQKYQNAKEAVYGDINITDALRVSSDVFFYHLGEWADNPKHKNPIQRWARKLGFGRTTEIDIPGERAGRVPDADWRNAAYKRYEKCTKKEGVTQGTEAALYACGGIEKGWTTGDNVNLAIGQGDLEATPIQVAVAYAAIANGGTIVRPHLGQAIEDGNGVKIQDLPSEPRRKIKINDAHRQVVLEGLYQAANAPGGTSEDVFAGFPKRYKIYGKTGTVERQPNPDQAWYAAFVMDKQRPLVVVVTVEKGGFGAETAAPAARMILSEWFDVDDDGEFHAGEKSD